MKNKASIRKVVILFLLYMIGFGSSIYLGIYWNNKYKLSHMKGFLLIFGIAVA